MGDMPPIRDRVRELRRVPARELKPNPRNWRTHPAGQRSALAGLLAEVGYAAALVARELPDGTLELIDGHLRAETTPEAIVPVLIVARIDEPALPEATAIAMVTLFMSFCLLMVINYLEWRSGRYAH